MKMKKEYCKPDTHYVLVGTYLMSVVSNKEQGPYEGGHEDGEGGDELSRFGFWDDFDEDLLEDVEDINDID